MSSHQCPRCDTPHNSANACTECGTTEPQLVLCRTHGTGYNPMCRTCRKLAGI